MEAEDIVRQKVDELYMTGYIPRLGYVENTKALMAQAYKKGLKENDIRATAAEIAGDALEAERDELLKQITLLQAESDGYLSQLLDVQKDCIVAKQELAGLIEWFSANLEETYIPSESSSFCGREVLSISPEVWEAKKKETEAKRGG